MPLRLITRALLSNLCGTKTLREVPTCALELQKLIEKNCIMTSEAQMSVVNKFNRRMNINMKLPTCAACKSRRFDDGTDISHEVALSEL